MVDDGAQSNFDVVPRPWPFADFVHEVANPSGRLGDIPAGETRCLHFSGLGLFGRELLTSAEMLTERLRSGRLTIPDILAGTGYFTAVLSSGGETLFVTDLLGLEHLYLHDGPRGQIVSNRLHALVTHLEAAGIERKLNIGYAALSLWSKHAFFRQCHAHDLAIDGVSLVPMDCYLAVAGGRLELRKKPLLAEAFGGVTGTYDALIEEAAEQIRQNITAILEAGLFDDISADLSGGKDSRIVFAGLISLGLATRVPTVTYDIPGTRDLKCALRIIASYHAPIYSGKANGPELFAETADASMREWRSYYMGMYHKMSIRSWSARGADRSTMRLTGACGGIYRSVWSNWLSPSLSGAREGKSLDAVFDWVLPEFPAEHRPMAVDAFNRSILSLPGGSALEKLDNHYLFFRNRAHFGMPANRVQEGGLSWAPLVTPALFLASRALPWEERHTGRVMFDILDRLAPELNFFKYDAGPWPKQFLDRSRWNGTRKPGADVDRDAVARRWNAAQAEAGRAAASRRSPSARPFRADEFKRLARAETERALDRILSSSPELAAILGPRFAADTMARFDEANEKHWLLLTSKIVSFSDMLSG